ncbi:hypothetical protein EC973_007462 [Apophysomyces ossiformis]|uniref:Uncharacterized protein n=1 Tax=Apophysomyces ossiformis TaxID=679940 RepID=A0A8H7EQX9_9FUNG|nr:hypothetical protein EC973_007462 [Apophysomyces ossiformis]
MLEAESLTVDFDNTEQQDNQQNQSEKDVTEPEEKPASTSTGQSEISHESNKSSTTKEDDSDNKQEDTPRPNVLFLYGLDEMSTNDIKSYCKGLNMQRIEWINDSSCNLVFATKEEAVAAATALLEQEVELTHTLLRKSKVHVREDRTFENLHIRVATTTDVKARGARERSRYYLLHGTEESNYDRDRLNDVDWVRDEGVMKLTCSVDWEGEEMTQGEVEVTTESMTVEEIDREGGQCLRFKEGPPYRMMRVVRLKTANYLLNYLKA